MTSRKRIHEGALPIVQRLAARVRTERKARGLPRRELSELSGVSPRYLAQLEAGEGNISIVLLARIASALQVRVEDLIGEAGPVSQDTARVAALYDQAGSKVQGQVRALLAPETPGALRAQRICLVGLRGAGKSTLGQLAADKLKIPFLELTDEIERQAGMPLDEVMALYGQDGYRTLEAEALAKVVADHDRLILAVAGGIVADTTTYEQVLTRFHTIWIKTSPAEHMARVRAQGDLRPIEGHPAAMKQLKAFLTAREPLYAQAQAQVDTAGKTLSTSLNDVLTAIATNDFLDRVQT